MEQQGWVAHDGGELYTRRRVVAISRPTVVLLCGLGFHTFEYEPLAEELAARCVNSVAFDYRGHGRSSGRRGRWTLDELASDAAAVIAVARQCGLRRIHLVGNSLGAMVAILAGAADPHVVSVVASNAPAHPREFLLTRRRRRLYRSAVPLSAVVPMRISVDHFYRYEELTTDAALIERIRRDRAIRAARRLALPTYRELLDTWDGPAAVRQLHHPLLLIHSVDDRLQPAEQTLQLLAAAGEPVRHWPIATGHLPHLDATHEFANLLTAWIDETDPTRHPGVASVAER